MLAKADSPLAGHEARPGRRSLVAARVRRDLRRLAHRTGGAGDEQGIALLEVIIASALVAIIAIGTLTGLEGATATTADNRLHNEAAVLAAQSQETLRSEPTETLETLAKETEETPSKPYVTTKTIENQQFTVTQEVDEVNGSTGATGCTATSTEGESTHPGGYYFKVTSVVSWPQLGSTRQPVKQTSIITPRTGSVLEVTVDTAGATPTPVSGATVNANGTITTTGSSGCVIYPAIKATTIPLTVEKLGYVTANGAEKFSAAEIAIAPDITTQYQVILSPAGRIKAVFTYKGAEVYSGSEVTGDTFIAANTELTTGTIEGGTAGTYGTSAQTPYTLTPFSSDWVTYAGDCTENNPEEVTKGVIKDPSVKVVGGEVATVHLPLSYVVLNVYEGTSASHSRPTASYEVVITNPLCAKLASTDTHKQKTTTPGSSEPSAPGHLSNPFQPFGHFTLCLYDSEKTYTAPYENLSEAGSTLTIYLGAGPKNGWKVETQTVEGVTIKTKQSKC
jgi:Tfp pilus assembly protein PilV